MRLDDTDILAHLPLATPAGALIGIERSHHGRPAGLRAHVLGAYPRRC